MSLLHLAAENNHVDLVNLCLNKGTNPNAVVEPYGTPFSAACGCGATDVVGLFLAACIDDAALVQLLNRRCGYAGTGLHYAAMAGQTGIVQLLLSVGAAVDLRNDAGHTALALAVGQGHAETVRVLYEDGAADPTLTTAFGQSSIDLAIRAPSDSNVFRTLIDMVPAELLDRPNSASYYPVHTAAAANKVDALEALLTAGCSFHHTTAAEMTPIHYAAASGAVNTLIWLCETLGMAYDEPSADGSLPLHLAAEEGHAEVVQWLLAQPSKVAVVGATNARGYTALHLAAMNGHETVISALLQAEPPADPTLTTPRGETPLVLARSRGHEGAETLLKSIGGADPRPVVYVSAECSLDARGKEYIRPFMTMKKVNVQSNVVCEL